VTSKLNRNVPIDLQKQSTLFINFRNPLKDINIQPSTIPRQLWCLETWPTQSHS